MATAAPEPKTIIVRPAGARWSVRVIPPVAGEDLDGCFETFKSARGFAGGLRLTRGWMIDAVDPHPKSADAE
jgi:hypothetical protein